MPKLSKKVLSLFMRTGCERQFRLQLYNTQELKDRQMPKQQIDRPILGFVQEEGFDYQERVTRSLQRAFGDNAVVAKTEMRGSQREKIVLKDELLSLKPHQFVIEAEYDANTPTFRTTFDLDALGEGANELKVAKCQLDILQVLPSRASLDGQPTSVNDFTWSHVLPDGRVEELTKDDLRLRLRIIDVKLSADPGGHYFGELVYYAITLSSWLADEGYSDRFVVAAHPAVWPGTHGSLQLSELVRSRRLEGLDTSVEELLKAMEMDLQVVPFDVIADQITALLRKELPRIIATPWQDLEWHPGNRCKGCEFLGFPYNPAKPSKEKDHCYPSSERSQHLAQIFGLTKGGARKLRIGGIENFQELSTRDHTDGVFKTHQGLKAKRTALPFRAQSLRTNVTLSIPNSGGDALMPRWPNLHIYVFLDFDLATTYTSSFGVSASWMEPLPYQSPFKSSQGRKSFPEKGEGRAITLLTREPQQAEEEARFLQFLETLKEIMGWVIARDRADVADQRRDKDTTHSTYQIYLWDENQRKQLIRLIGRHLASILADPKLRTLAWLFPPPELLPEHETASRESPITLVSTVIQNTVAAAIPYQYTLLELARTYLPEGINPVTVHPLFQEPFSDLIPADRLYEGWSQSSKWHVVAKITAETTEKKVLALRFIVGRLEADLKDKLSRLSAPKLIQTQRTTLTKVPPHSALLYEFSKLDAAVTELDTQMALAMPPHEREARFKSARLTKRLEGAERASALAQFHLVDEASLLVYRLSPDSIDVNLRTGDLGYALAPEKSAVFYDTKCYRYTKDLDLDFSHYYDRKTFGQAGITGVDIEGIDRVHEVIVLRMGMFNLMNVLEDSFDFSQNLTLDKIPADYYTAKLKATLEAIGFPQSALGDNALAKVINKTIKEPSRGRFSPESTAATFLWQAEALSKTPVQREISSLGPDWTKLLNPSQSKAWEEALTRRLTLVWGPPGTGKSWTLRMIILAAVLEAQNTGRSLRLLVTANTYNAVDNILFKLKDDVAKLQVGMELPRIIRLQSDLREAPDTEKLRTADITNYVVERYRPTPEVLNFRHELETSTGDWDVIVVGCPTQQLHNLAVAGVDKKDWHKHAKRDFFDFVVLDEASQVDVGASTFVFTKIAPDGCCVLAGDDLQLPPIHQAEAPLGYQKLTGSIFSYLSDHCHVTRKPLQVNYRSNRVLVNFVRRAGYDEGLKSFHPDLQIHLISEVPTVRPEGWPDSLFWTPDWAKLLTPEDRAVCLLYEDDSSSQVNPFEADAVAAMVWLLRQRLAKKLREGEETYPEDDLHDAKSFWEEAVGIVTPHRAQMSRVIQSLSRLFPGEETFIRSAVDTVERFQGQERAVIIASFGIGDEDIIRGEDEFLYDLRRFNVLASRAQAKLIVMLTRALVNHLSDDVEVLRESVLLKRFALNFCEPVGAVSLGYVDAETEYEVVGELRTRREVQEEGN